MKMVLTVGQAAAMLEVGNKSLSGWTDAGLVPYYTTPGGHRRFRLADILAFGEKMRGGGFNEVNKTKKEVSK
jgi:excisionase family DNA binding protein